MRFSGMKFCLVLMTFFVFHVDKPILAAEAADPTAVSAKAAASNLRIVYTALVDGHTDLFIINADGSAETNLTHSNASDYDPSVSPDGKHIVFVSNREENSEIYVMTIDGKNVRRLTSNQAEDRFPDWSPDNKHIVFASDRDTKSTLELYVMNIDGTNVQRLTNNDFVDTTPSWSPDGSQIAFMSNRDKNSEIYTMDVQTKTVTRVTYNAGSDKSNIDESPSWSPDGKSILFHSFRNYVWGVYETQLDGKRNNSHCLHCGADGAFDPEWSPDGQYVAFVGTGGIDIADKHGTLIDSIGHPMEFAREKLLDWVP